MTAASVIAALCLPADARVDQRVPKKLLVENGAPTAAYALDSTTILQILSLTLFEKTPISQALAQLPPTPASLGTDNHQCLLAF